ncbi:MULTISPECIES: hypothetical protein [Amycolatopsis]|uniref:Uncharacterized protein n=1 Tax=Amycolatopsis dendrobii TaxID=2760662 RepID=A0A7W3W201_9PSEU|nr:MULTISPECIES: hypothetical protein [Amycolatopsis]MBB1156857.1 hypothetical protein [Amycolatopsis dendrobii]UKD53562.1 hypothetical protein L3Q65_37600 [Amycolatopsis sp. FU40]
MTGDPRPDPFPGPDDQAFPARSRKPLARRPAWWIGLASAAFFVTGIVFFLLPVTALYYLDDAGNPTDVRAIYGTRSDQMLGLPANMFGRGDPPTDTTSVRIGCGTALSTPESWLITEAHGAEGCSAAERPRMIIGWLGVGLGMLGAAGLVVGGRRQPRPNAAQTHFPFSAGS